MKVGIIGAGRIGKVHAKNITMFVPELEIKAIATAKSTAGSSRRKPPTTLI